MDEKQRIGLRHRLLGREDIQFDTENTDAKETFTSPWGTEHTLTRLNASHIPLGEEATIELREQSVSSALVSLKDDIQKISDQIAEQEGLNSDTTYTLNGVTNDDIHALDKYLDSLHSRLNGHTLSISVSTSGRLGCRLRVHDFNDGKIIIDLNSQTLSGYSNDDGGLITFQDCNCIVEIKNGTIDFSRGTGLCLSLVSAALISNVTFNADGADGNAAVFSDATNISFKSCVFNGTKPLKCNSEEYFEDVNGDGVYLRSGNGYGFLLEEMDTEVKDISDKIAKTKESYDTFVNSSADSVEDFGAENGVSWRKWKSGILEMHGVSRVSKAVSNVFVHHIVFPSGCEFAATDYAVTITAMRSADGELTLDGDGNPTAYSSQDADSYAGRAVLCGNQRKTDGFYVYSRGRGTNGDRVQVEFAWTAFGIAKTGNAD